LPCQHDNARCHTVAATSAAAERIAFVIVPHSPCSLDVAPSDFWLFGDLKEYLKDSRFTCVEEAQDAMAKWFREQSEKFYTDGFEKFVQRWWRCT
jgi:hypothetical protein